MGGRDGAAFRIPLWEPNILRSDLQFSSNRWQSKELVNQYDTVLLMFNTESRHAWYYKRTPQRGFFSPVSSAVLYFRDI